MAFYDLQERADIKKLCATSVLLSRRRDPAKTGTWKWRAPPVEVRGDSVVHCIGDRLEDGATKGSLFRTGV